MAALVEMVTTTTEPLRDGDVFIDAEGVIWSAQHDARSDAPTVALLVWHAENATTSREGEDTVPIDTLATPLRLIVRLGEVRL